MHYLEFRWIEKAPAVQSVRGNEIAPSVAPEGDCAARIRGAKRAVRSGHAARRPFLPKTGARRHLDNEARLIAILCGRGAGDDLHGLNRIHGNLVGENLALLVGDGLPVNRERIFRVITQSMEKTIG